MAKLKDQPEASNGDVDLDPRAKQDTKVSAGKPNQKASRYDDPGRSPGINDPLPDSGLKKAHRSTADYELLGSTVLPNGMPVDFYEDMPPDLSDVAVCFVDLTGAAVESNESLLERVNVSVEPDAFHPPWTRLEVTHRTKLLLVSASVADATLIGAATPDTPLPEGSVGVRALRQGVQEEVKPDGIETLWVSPRGLSNGAMSTEQELRACLSTLATLSGRGRFRVLLSCTGQEPRTMEEVFDWQDAAAPLNLEGLTLEPHVKTAFSLADRSAGDEPINARHLTEAIVALAATGHSEAFSTFGDFLLLPSTLSEDVVQSAQAVLIERGRLVSPHLAMAFFGLPHYIRQEGTFWGRDLIATLLLSRDPSLEQLARDTGTSVASLRDRWITFVLAHDQKRRTQQVWINWWQDSGFTADNLVRRSGYLPELLKTEDKLGIQREANAFAGLICDESVAPPLSIALLGDWGSGKSFFMNKIKKKVESSRGIPGFCENPVSIDFNAWHMSDANLWASLVDHIFQELRNKLFPEDEIRKAFENELAAAQGAFHEAQEELENARQDLSDAQAEVDKATDELSSIAVGENVRTAAHALGLEDVYKSVIDLERAWQELSDATANSSRTLSAALQPSALHRGLCWVGVSVVLGAMVATTGVWIPETVPDNENFKDALRMLGTVGGVVGSLVGSITGALSKGAQLVGDFNEAVREGMDTHLDRLNDSNSKEAKARLRMEAARAGLSAARTHLEGVERRHGGRDPARALSRFIEERAQSEDYRARQGLISLVRRDFEKLADMMRELQEYRRNPETQLVVEAPNESVTPAKQSDATPVAKTDESGKSSSEHWMRQGKLVDRVILYIDDLDRCKPKRVVEVLEAVHLLLGLDLFVVVVSVDSRWMLRALEVHYSDLLRADGEKDGEDFRESTPQNYLEKIFQIPFALAPMSETGFKNYVQFLVKDGVVRVRDTEDGAHRREVLTDASSAMSEGEAGPQSEQAGTRAKGTSEEPETKKEDESEERPIWGALESSYEAQRIVVITRREHDVIEQVGALLPTPRQAKRLVNVFRLLKSQVDDKELASFEDVEGGHRAVIVLLAILFGRPSLARLLFRNIFELEESPQDPLHVFVKSWGDKLGAPAKKQENPSLAADAIALASILERIQQKSKLKVTSCFPWVGVVARYSLMTGQEWHTWKPGTPVRAAMEARQTVRDA